MMIRSGLNRLIRSPMPTPRYSAVSSRTSAARGDVAARPISAASADSWSVPGSGLPYRSRIASAPTYASRQPRAPHRQVPAAHHDRGVPPLDRAGRRAPVGGPVRDDARAYSRTDQAARPRAARPAPRRTTARPGPSSWRRCRCAAAGWCRRAAAVPAGPLPSRNVCACTSASGPLLDDAGYPDPDAQHGRRARRRCRPAPRPARPGSPPRSRRRHAAGDPAGSRPWRARPWSGRTARRGPGSRPRRRR